MKFSSAQNPGRLHHLLGLAGLCLICVLLYWPGLDSPFLFDDMPNLGALEQLHGLGPLDEGFQDFVATGRSGPLGRPVSLFTFALQADSWPGNPFAFKVVNLVLHLVNGVLVYGLLLLLGTTGGLNTKSRFWVATATTALWLLHPAQSVTVLYVVQRMTLLSTAFMLASLTGYLWLRLRYRESWQHPLFLSGLLLCVLASVTGLFAKENAASLLFFILTFEYTLLDKVPANRLIANGRKILWLPVLALLMGVIINFDSLTAGFNSLYEYGPWQRLLTQARILWFQVWHTLVPTSASSGLFIHFDPSTGISVPVTTRFSVLSWLAVIFLALGYRKVQPLFAFAVFWFLSAHLFESSILPLELFFNHRNYLAMLGPLFLGVMLVEKAVVFLQPRINPDIVRLVPSAFILIFALQLGVNAKMWQSPLVLASHWVAVNPEAERNRQFLASELAASGQVDEAIGIYAAMIRLDDEPDLWSTINYLTLSCRNTRPLPISREQILEISSEALHAGRGVVSLLRQLNQLVIVDDCPGLDTSQMKTLMNGAMHLLSSEDQGFLAYELALLVFQEGNITEAMSLMDQAWEATGDSGILYIQANILINQGENALALEKVEAALAGLESHNILSTGTRAMKRQTLNAMRDYLLQEQP